MYVKNANGDYLRVDDATLICVDSSGGTWFLYIDSNTAAKRFGGWSTEPEALDALEKLVQTLGKYDTGGSGAPT